MQEETTVLSNEQAGVGCRRLRLAAPGICRAARPGQFVHVLVAALGPGAMRRPISICDADCDSGALTLVFKIVGRGTEALAGLRPGESVDLIGPLGSAFPAPGDLSHVSVALVGGGYGVAPLFFLARRLVASGLPAPVLFAGGRTAADLLLLDDFHALGVDVRVATEDGSAGVRGLVTAPLDAWLAGFDGAGASSAGADGARPPTICACGPAPMLRALDGRARSHGYPAWLSMDRRMACGIGACLGCVQPVRGPDGSRALARVCADGPVFPSGAIIWD